MGNEKKMGRFWISWGTTYGFALGFAISKSYITADLGFWYVGIEF